MTPKQGLQLGQARRLPLVGPFEHALQHLEAAPSTPDGGALAAFASSLLNSEEFNLERIDALSNKYQQLCLDLFEYCMTTGLSEDERREASNEFSPYSDMHAPGTRH